MNQQNTQAIDSTVGMAIIRPIVERLWAEQATERTVYIATHDGTPLAVESITCGDRCAYVWLKQGGRLCFEGNAPWLFIDAVVRVGRSVQKGA